MLELHEIQQIQIELTTRCNARCPMCMRNYRGLDYNAGYPETELTLEDIKTILTPKILSQLTKGIRFNGNLGDFGLARDALEIVEWLVDQQVKVIVNTNGSMRTPAWWSKLALPGVNIGFALDGIDTETHSLYRQDTNWDTIIKNARAFIDAGGDATWRLIPFKHNQHQIEDCKKLAKELGFKHFDTISDGRDNGPVYTRTGEFSHWLGEPWVDGLPDLKDLVTSHVTWYDSKTVNSDRDKTPLSIGCLFKRSKELYIAANGEVFPCCFLGYYPGTMNHPGNQELKPLIKHNNALEYPLEECIEWFNEVEQSWARPSVAEGRLYTCVNTCGQWAPPIFAKHTHDTI